jgi:hypothetical protein
VPGPRAPVSCGERLDAIAARVEARDTSRSPGRGSDIEEPVVGSGEPLRDGGVIVIGRGDASRALDREVVEHDDARVLADGRLSMGSLEDLLVPFSDQTVLLVARSQEHDESLPPCPVALGDACGLPITGERRQRMVDFFVPECVAMRSDLGAIANADADARAPLFARAVRELPASPVSCLGMCAHLEVLEYVGLVFTGQYEPRYVEIPISFPLSDVERASMVATWASLHAR